MNRLLDRTEVARQLNVSLQTVDRLRKTGSLKAIMVRGRVRFRIEDLQSYIETQRKGARS